MATYVIVHGAWGGAWSWNRFVVPRLRARGHDVFPATLTGLGDRTHFATPQVDLETHVQDLSNVLFYEDLRDVILVGHSYGGRVITGVADRAADRLRRLVYVDAAVPTPDDPGGGPRPAAIQARIDAEGDGWRHPPGPPPPDQPAEVTAWATPRRSWQRLRTFTQPLAFANPTPVLPRTYVYCTVGKDAASPLAATVARLRDDPAWDVIDLETGQDLIKTAPDATVEILHGLA